MANMHVLTNDGPEYTIVFHIAIPNTSNPAGVNYRTALIRSGIGGKTVLPDGDGTGGTISAAEKSQIQAGAVYEVVEKVRFSSTQDGTSLTLLRAQHTAITNREQAQLSQILTQYGRVID